MSFRKHLPAFVEDTLPIWKNLQFSKGSSLKRLGGTLAALCLMWRLGEAAACARFR